MMTREAEAPTRTKRSNSAVTLDQVPAWNDLEVFPTLSDVAVEEEEEDRRRRRRRRGPSVVGGSFADPLISPSPPSSSPHFPCDDFLNSKLFLWRGDPWTLQVDAVVNSTNELLDLKESSPGLHMAAGPRLAEDCAGLSGCRTGMAQITGAYELPARWVLHTVGPKYMEKYHSAAENALSRCYQSCFELLIEHRLQSIAFGCIHTNCKGYPREQGAHVALRTIRRFLERHKEKVRALVLCFAEVVDADIYERLLLLYFPRNRIEEHNALLNLQADVGDENGETSIAERKIRIKALPVSSDADVMPSNPDPLKAKDPSSISGISSQGLSLDSSFLSMVEDPDRRREEQWERARTSHTHWSWWGSPQRNDGGLDTPYHRYLAQAKAVDLSKVAEMKIMYRGGIDRDGHPVMIVVGAHFLLRCLDLEQFLLFVLKEFEPLIKRPYTIVYFHSAAALQCVPDTGWMRRIHQIMGPRHKLNLHRIYIVHPTLGLRASVLLLRLLADSEVWAKVAYTESLSDLFRYVSQKQLTIPDFVFQHDVDLHTASQHHMGA